MARQHSYLLYTVDLKRWLTFSGKQVHLQISRERSGFPSLCSWLVMITIIMRNTATMFTLAILMMLLIRAIKTLQNLAMVCPFSTWYGPEWIYFRIYSHFTSHSNLSSYVKIAQIHSRCSSREWNVTTLYLLHPQGWSYSIDGSCSTWLFSCCYNPHESQAQC